jgi:hypothetical protein
MKKMNKYQKGGEPKKSKSKPIDPSKAKPVTLKKPSSVPKISDPKFIKTAPKVNDPGFKKKESTSVKPYKKGGSIKKK